MSDVQKETHNIDSNEWRRSLEASLQNEKSNCSHMDRINYVRSMTDQLQLSIDDIRGSSVSNKLNALNSIPKDLLPFEIKLVDGRKVLLIGINPVCTCFEDKIDDLRGDIVHLYVRRKGEELPSDFLPPKRMFTVPPPPLGFVRSPNIKVFELPTVDKNYVPPKPSTSTEENLPISAEVVRNDKSTDTEMSTKITINSQSNSKLDMDLKSDSNLESSRKEKVLTSSSNIESISPFKKDSIKDFEKSNVVEKNISPYVTSDFSSKFQVVGLIETKCVDELSTDMKGYKKYTRKQTPTALILIQKDEEDIMPCHKMGTRSKSHSRKSVQELSNPKQSLRCNARASQGKKSPNKKSKPSIKDSKSPVLNKKARSSDQCTQLRSTTKTLNPKSKKSPNKKRQHSKFGKISKSYSLSPDKK